MTSLVDSSAHFQKRCREMGISERALARLTGNNFDTLGKLAFSIGQPGQPIEQGAFDTYAQNVLGAMTSQADTAILKRLVFEGHTLLLGQLRELVTDPNAAGSRKLPAIEREHRMAQLKNKLTGVVIERQMEPSHELLELMSQQKEMNQISYIGLERCCSREWEVTMGKNKRQVSLDAEKLVIKERSDVPDQAYGSELQAFEALRRRGLAMCFADIISWNVHERYIQQLTSHLRNEPPPNYVRPSLPQILKADRQVFLWLMRNGVDLKRQPDNSLELDMKMLQALESYEVGFHLLPLPKLAGRSEGSSQQQGQSPQQPFKNNSRSQPYQSKGKGKYGQQKGKGKGGQGVLPKPLLGRNNVPVDSHNRRLCFNYQMGKCSEVADGAQCNRGWHLCTRRGCHAPHPEKDHDAKQKWQYDRIRRLALAGAALNECIVIEVFCGTARLTACLKQFNVSDSFGTDVIRHKQAMGPVVTADLTTRSGQELLFQWLDDPRVVGVFLAPPRGSASRARSIPIKRKRTGNPPPQPLRNDQHPNGLPFLSFFDKIKISKANKLYHLTAEIVKYCHHVGIIFCIENPQFSLFWSTTYMQDICHLLNFAVFHTCQYGGSRLKRTMLAFNADAFQVLCKTCPGSSSKHTHKKWGYDKAIPWFWHVPLQVNLLLPYMTLASNVPMTHCTNFPNMIRIFCRLCEPWLVCKLKLPLFLPWFRILLPVLHWLVLLKIFRSMTFYRNCHMICKFMPWTPQLSCVKVQSSYIAKRRCLTRNFWKGGWSFRAPSCRLSCNLISWRLTILCRDQALWKLKFGAFLGPTLSLFNKQ